MEIKLLNSLTSYRVNLKFINASSIKFLLNPGCALEHYYKPKNICSQAFIHRSLIIHKLSC